MNKREDFVGKLPEQSGVYKAAIIDSVTNTLVREVYVQYDNETQRVRLIIEKNENWVEPFNRRFVIYFEKTFQQIDFGRVYEEQKLLPI